MMDLRLALMCGTDIPVPECQLTIHQPRIEEIALIGEQDFFIGVQMLTINKNIVNKDETLLTDTTNFQIFMTMMQEKQLSDKKEAVMKLLQIIFPLYNVSILPRGIAVVNKEDGKLLTMLDESNFDSLQEYLKLIFCNDSSQLNQTSFNPADEQAKAIAQKLMRGRERVAAQKGEKQSSVLSQYISTLVVGLHSMSLSECNKLTLYQLFDLIQRYMLYLDWDMDIRSRLAGAKPDHKPDNWMKNIH